MSTTTMSRAASGAAAAVLAAVVVGTAVLPAAAAPGVPAEVPARASAAHSARAVVPARGTISALPDVSTLTASPAHGGTRCLFRVESVLELGGAVDGTATGQTRATIHAPCDEATSNPPGTFADTFAFTGDFRGTVGEEAVLAEVTYGGVTRAGGEVSALLFLDGDATVVTAVRAGIDDTGTFSGAYRGIATTP